MDNMLYYCNNLTSLRLGTNFDKLTGTNMFNYCSNLKAIITPRTTIMTLNAESTTSTGLKTLTNSILYVPSTTAEATFEADPNYVDILGVDRIKPILELVGNSSITAYVGDKNIDSGVLVAGMSKNTDGTTYTPYGYTVSIKQNGTAVSSIDTSSKGTYTITYTVHEPNSSIDGMSVTRTVNVVQIDINSSNITATIPSETRIYTGNAYTPVVTVKDGSTTLTLNTDYTVSYANNTNAGTATITITGKGKYWTTDGNRNG